MKMVLELLAASALAAGMIMGGVMLASAGFAPEDEPHRFTGLDIKDLWTSEPMRIDRSAQNLERLPPRYASHVAMNGPDLQSTDRVIEITDARELSNVGEVEMTETSDARLMTAGTDDAGISSMSMNRERVMACMESYRSYRVSNNTFQPYGGGPREPCQLVSF